MDTRRDDRQVGSPLGDFAWSVSRSGHEVRIFIAFELQHPKRLLGYTLALMVLISSIITGV